VTISPSILAPEYCGSTSRTETEKQLHNCIGDKSIWLSCFQLHKNRLLQINSWPGKEKERDAGRKKHLWINKSWP
jgi:hypothetical protein